LHSIIFFKILSNYYWKIAIMKKTLLAFIMLCFAAGNLFASITGSGTQADPFIISEPADLVSFMDETTAQAQGYWVAGTYTELAADLDMGTVTEEKPIGNSTNKFLGHFDGKGYVISNITITARSSNYQGLFGYIGTGATVSNLGVEDANVNGKNHVGGFVGDNSGTITYCYATGNASGQTLVGGFVGNNSGTIEYCYATGNATGLGAGGFVGNNSGTIENCYSIGVPYAGGGSGVQGGFVGADNSGNYDCCFWNKTTSGMDVACGNPSGSLTGITGLDNSQFANPASFSCFNFEDGWVMGYNVKDSEYLYPMLRAFDYAIIPTLTEWAVIIFIGLLAGVGGWFVWRRM
jgi:hypothetical protein